MVVTSSPTATLPEAGRHLGLALTVIASAQLMVVLDGTITNIALPSLKEDLDISASGLAWVVNSYVLAFGGLLLLGGRIGDLFGRRRIFRIGIALFTLASLLGHGVRLVPQVARTMIRELLRQADPTAALPKSPGRTMDAWPPTVRPKRT